MLEWVPLDCWPAPVNFLSLPRNLAMIPAWNISGPWMPWNMPKSTLTISAPWTRNRSPASAPMIDYSSVVYHSLLTSRQADSIENLQATALKKNYGYSQSYHKILELYSKKLERLHDRRERLVDKFVLKAYKNGRFCDRWFLKKSVPVFLFKKQDDLWRDLGENWTPLQHSYFYYRQRLNDMLRTWWLHNFNDLFMTFVFLLLYNHLDVIKYWCLSGLYEHF